MSVLDTILSSMGPGVVQQITNQFCLDGNQATSALSALIPVLAGGLKDKVTGDGAPGLMDTITGSTFQQFADNPASLSSPAAIQQGNSLLSQIFGGSEALSDITSKASESSGLSSPLLRSMLPVVASLLMGYISKNAAGDPAKVTDLVSSLAGGGGIVDALKGLASKVFGG